MMGRVKLPDAREAEIQRAILATLKHLGVDCWRHNVGGFPVESGGTRRYVRAGEKGQSDILGLLPGGRFCAVEVKRPGNRPTADQIAFMQRINEAGGFAFWATSAQTVENVVRAALLNPTVRVVTADDGSQDLTDEEPLE